MIKSGTAAEPELFGFVLLPNFAMMSCASATEPLRAANRLSGRTLYQWRFISVDGNPVTSSSGIEIAAHHAIGGEQHFDRIFVVAGINAHDYYDRALFAWLRRLNRQGCPIGAFSTGTYILARAGLLSGFRCTVHWENLASFQEEFPELEVTAEIFEIDRARATCSGGIAAMDLMLSLIGLSHGRHLATEVAEQFMHERIRDQRDEQRMGLRSRLGVSHPKLLEIIDLMEQHLEEPLPRSELARHAALSTRQLERLFRKYLGCTPTRYYLELRLHRARHLLAQTSMSVLDVALACGFVSASHFSKCYRELFQKTPREERIYGK